jgi:hypothetical protein
MRIRDQGWKNFGSGIRISNTGFFFVTCGIRRRYLPYETPPGDIVTQVSDETLSVQVGLEVGVLVHLPPRQPGHLHHTTTTKVIGAPLERKQIRCGLCRIVS